MSCEYGPDFGKSLCFNFLSKNDTIMISKTFSPNSHGLVICIVNNHNVHMI